jgi:hypothetical protein
MRQQHNAVMDEIGVEGRAICAVWVRQVVAGGVAPWPEGEANARLLIASTDLLKAARTAFFAIGGTGANADTNHPLRTAWEALRAAIAMTES